MPVLDPGYRSAPVPWRARELWGVIPLAVAVAAYFVWIWIVDTSGRLPAHDIHHYYYPNMRYAVASVTDGLRGFFWNRFQDCGEPFFGISSTGPLYPANVLFFFLTPPQALFGVTLFNLTVAGVFAYLLCRQLGVGITAAVCGALTFELGNSTIDLSTWGPQMGGPFVWLAAQMFFCERILRAPSGRDAIGLAISLALPLLPGFPQAVFFSYQVIALRVVWELLFHPPARAPAVVTTLLAGLLLGPLLVAVHLVPGMETAGHGLRSTNLTLAEIAGFGGMLDWNGFRRALGNRGDLFNPLLLIPFVVAAASGLTTARRRYAVFYLTIGGLYFLLGLGVSTPVFKLYMLLPLGRMFRDPYRFFWVTSFALAVLAALGAQAITDGAPSSWKRRTAIAVGSAVALGVYYLMRPAGFLWFEALVAGLALASIVLASIRPAWSTAATIVIAIAIAMNVLLFPIRTAAGWLSEWTMRAAPMRPNPAPPDPFAVHDAAFAALRERMSAQDRLYIVAPVTAFHLGPKTAATHGVPAVHDYEPQPTRRYAEYYLAMRNGKKMRSLNEYYYAPEMLPYNFNRPLLNLAAGRYIIIDGDADGSPAISPLTQPLSIKDAGLRAYENLEALPRAFYIPRIEVLPDASEILRQLRLDTIDPRAVALVEEAPPSGFRGASDDGSGARVEFTLDDPEHLALRVQAPERGFLFLSDQYFPGWEATVNGTPTPIQRANYLFRLVEVPAGESTVEFRYAPWSVRIGAVISLLAAGGTAVWLVATRAKRRRIAAA